MDLAGGKRSGNSGRDGDGAGREGGRKGRERRRFRRYSSRASPPGFFPASGYLLIGYSKISETRRYRRGRRGEMPERRRESRRKRGKRMRCRGKGGGVGREGIQVGGLSRTVCESGG